MHDRRIKVSADTIATLSEAILVLVSGDETTASDRAALWQRHGSAALLPVAGSAAQALLAAQTKGF